MKSRKDQVQAYFFVLGRLVAAVTHGKPEALQSPSRRLATGTVFGVLLAGVLMAVFGILGLFVPATADKSWQQAGTIVMDKTTGARYIFLDGQLRPVLNYSSARLAAGTSGSGSVVSVSPGSLSGVPVGQPIGIAGAPDSLPPANKLDGGPWTVCVQPPGSDPATKGPAVTVLLSRPPSPAIGDEQAMLVSTSDGVPFLVWKGKRFRLSGRGVKASLGYGNARTLAVTPAWLNPIPQGSDIDVPGIPGIGQPGPAIEGRQSRIGQIYEVRNPAIGTDQLYLLRRDGMALLSRTGAALLLAAPQTQQAYPGQAVLPVQAGPAALTDVPTSAAPDPFAELPPSPPQLLVPPPDSFPCMRFEYSAAGAPAPVAALLPAAQIVAASVPTAGHAAGAAADRVAIPVGSGVLARELPAPGAVPGPVYLITEVGTKYPLADADVVTALGYSPSSAVSIPAQLLSLLPSGPLLSADGARRAQPVKP